MSYIPVFILMLVGCVIGGVVLILSSLLGRGRPHWRKNIPFECGVPSTHSSQHRLSVRFYLVALLFLLFDVESIFFYPFAVVYRKYLELNNFVLYEMGFFVSILAVGYLYVLRKGALEWE